LPAFFIHTAPRVLGEDREVFKQAVPLPCPLVFDAPWTVGQALMGWQDARLRDG